jgi:hypothetical protein
MPITRRVYVSLPADPWLSPNLNALKWGIVEEIEKLKYTPEIFTNPKGHPGLASGSDPFDDLVMAIDPQDRIVVAGTTG